MPTTRGHCGSKPSARSGGSAAGAKPPYTATPVASAAAGPSPTKPISMVGMQRDERQVYDGRSPTPAERSPVSARTQFWEIIARGHGRPRADLLMAARSICKVVVIGLPGVHKTDFAGSSNVVIAIEAQRS
jgi:hypothetical protein